MAAGCGGICERRSNSSMKQAARLRAREIRFCCWWQSTENTSFYESGPKGWRARRRYGALAAANRIGSWRMRDKRVSDALEELLGEIRGRNREMEVLVQRALVANGALAAWYFDSDVWLSDLSWRF